MQLWEQGCKSMGMGVFVQNKLGIVDVQMLINSLLKMGHSSRKNKNLRKNDKFHCIFIESD